MSFNFDVDYDYFATNRNFCYIESTACTDRPMTVFQIVVAYLRMKKNWLFLLCNLLIRLTIPTIYLRYIINPYANEGYVFFFLKCSLPSYPHEPQQKTYHILKNFVKCMYFYNIQEELSQRFFLFLQIYQKISLKL